MFIFVQNSLKIQQQKKFLQLIIRQKSRGELTKEQEKQVQLV